MMKWILSFLSIVLSATLQAQSMELIGSIPVMISTSDKAQNAFYSTSKHIVYVQNLRLSPAAQQVLKERVATYSKGIVAKTEDSMVLPSKVDLGMNGTPVLDQGAHGSCVTFATTGALDAALGRGDYISQLCSLELGSYLQNLGLIAYSGWEGSFGTIVLDQLNNYGVVSKLYQQRYGCAGIKQYPLLDKNDKGRPMSIGEYTANSLPLSFAQWEVLADAETIFSNDFEPGALLRSVKKNLSEGKRITFGILLDDTLGDAGAVATFKKSYDTWVLTPELIKKIKRGGLKAGHEMIIIGYDDKAEALTADGTVSKGLFIVRNSWGKQSGDGGNFYISYEYFKALCDEAQVIIPKV